MAVIRTFISHHGEDYEPRVAPILRQVAKLGVRPWLDKIDLADRVVCLSKISSESDSARRVLVCLPVSKQRVDQAEVGGEGVDDRPHSPRSRFRILPVLLDPRDSLELPETFLRFLDGERKVIWLEPGKPGFAERYARSVYHAGGLDQDAKEVTLCIGHRILLGLLRFRLVLQTNRRWTFDSHHRATAVIFRQRRKSGARSSKALIPSGTTFRSFSVSMSAVLLRLASVTSSARCGTGDTLQRRLRTSFIQRDDQNGLGNILTGL